MWFPRQLKKRQCSKKVVYRHVPILSWLPKYSVDNAICDLIAGVTVGLTVIPQSMAYAVIAGLGPHYGLYAAFMSCFVYIILGSCKDVTIGPTAVMGLLTYENTFRRGPDFAVMLCFMTGCIELILGVFHMGFFVDFISLPVTSGFTSAAAVTIASSQIKPLLGLNIKSQGFVETIRKVAEHIQETRLGDTLLGFSCIIVLLTLRKLKEWNVTSSDDKVSRKKAILRKVIWVSSMSRNALVVLISGITAYSLHSVGQEPFTLTGKIVAGLPSFQPPPFQYTDGNTTLSYLEVWQELGTGALITSLIAILQNVAIAKAFAHGKSVDATQEMIALGVGNILGSFVRSLPVSGSFSRSAVNNSSGVKTTMGGLYTGVLVLLSLAFLTPYFFYIPKATLAAVIISAVLFMVEYHVVRPIWKCRKIDLIPAFVTFAACLLLGMEYGIVIGVAINLVFLLYSSARPSVRVETAETKSGIEYLLVTPDRSVVFPSVEYVCSAVTKAGIKNGSSTLPVVMDCRFVQSGDFTTAKGLESLTCDFKKRKQPLVFWNVRPKVSQLVKGLSLHDLVHCDTEEELEALVQGCKSSIQEPNGDVAVLLSAPERVESQASDPLLRVAEAKDDGPQGNRDAETCKS